MVNITINGKSIQVKDNTTILDACRSLNIEIPTLCHLNLHEINYYNAPASCRACVVELADGRLVTSCSTICQEGMDIRTETRNAVRARRNVVELLLSDHPKDCLICGKNLNCELQTMARDMGIWHIKYEGETSNYPVDKGAHAILRDPNKCILCMRCVTMCSNIQTVHALSPVERGFDTYVGSAFELPMNQTTCTFCGQCVSVCPTGALLEVNNTEQVWEALDSDKHVIVQTAPAIRVAIGEEFGFAPGTNVTGKLVRALKDLGFAGVFDTNFAADLTIAEEGAEFIQRLENGGPFPLITSCCPAWVNFMESQFEDFLENPSTSKSPHQMFGAVAKSYYAKMKGVRPEDIVVVSVMPCVAKKEESLRAELSTEGLADVDIVVTTRELARLIREAGISFEHLEDADFDNPLGESTGGATIFGATGGVITATLRSCQKLLTGDENLVLEFEELKGFKGIKQTTVNVAGHELKIAVTNGLGNIRTILEGIRAGEMDFHAVEVMACPGGCIGGAGQPYHHGDLSILEKRTKAIYDADKEKTLRISTDNPDVQKLYEEYLGEVGGHRAHELLHTSYTPRTKF